MPNFVQKSWWKVLNFLLHGRRRMFLTQKHTSWLWNERFEIMQFYFNSYLQHGEENVILYFQIFRSLSNFSCVHTWGRNHDKTMCRVCISALLPRVSDTWRGVTYLQEKSDKCWTSYSKKTRIDRRTLRWRKKKHWRKKRCSLQLLTSFSMGRRLKWKRDWPFCILYLYFVFLCDDILIVILDWQ